MNDSASSHRAGRPSTDPSIPRFDSEPATPSSCVRALDWLAFGFRIIPVVEGEKRTAVKWDTWLAGLSDAAATAHWTEHPSRDVGAILGDELIVFDADSPASRVALESIERRHGVASNMVVQTRRGVHHYFRRAPGVTARSDAHDTSVHPARIDVKTGRALVVLPPSGGRALLTAPLRSTTDLVEADQAFIDAIFIHNGRTVPRSVASPRVRGRHPSLRSGREAELAALLEHIDPDLGYEDWLHVLMAIHYETDGSETGLALADEWCSRGRKYRGFQEVTAKWHSFRLDRATAYTSATLRGMVAETGEDPIEICAATGPQFERCETEVVEDSQSVVAICAPTGNPLDRFSLRGRSADVEKNVVAQVFLLGQLALLGQFTVFYASPNVGKTLIVLHLLTEAIRNGVVDPGRVYYVNVDDDSNGLLTKLSLADEFGFHMLADGYQDFSTGSFLGLIAEMVRADQVRGVVLVLDTLKKFVDLMDKGRSSAFTKVARTFVAKGGTIVALAHTNKHHDSNGKPVFAGTSDVRDDSDCVYTIRELSGEPGGEEKVVVFENIKRRGNVATGAAYRYSTESGISYYELLASVQPFDRTRLQVLQEADEVRSDAVLVAVVQECIRNGVNMKMRLADAVAQRARVSKRNALRVLEKYTGDDPNRHRWQFAVGARGAKIFVLLKNDRSEPSLGQPSSTEGGSHE